MDRTKASSKQIGQLLEHFHPVVSPEVLLKYTSSADFGVCFVEDSCLSWYCLPNKLFEYLMAVCRLLHQFV